MPVAEKPGDEIYQVQLSEIHVSGQYGISFRAVVGGLPRPDGTLTAFLNVPSETSRGGRATLSDGTYFIKCPDTKLSMEKRKEFVDHEFRNGPSINHVADRAASRGGMMSINRMIGRARLRAPRWNNEDQECLIYQYAGDEGKENWTLATQWDEKFSESPEVFLNFAENFAEVIKVLHNQGIVHTFLVPRNIIWKGDQSELPRLKGTFTLVGFGYARYTDEAGRRSHTGSPTGEAWRIADEDNWFRAPECRKEHSHAAFGYPADIYSIGAILYFLLLGKKSTKAMEVLRNPPTDVRLLKTLVAKHLVSPSAQAELLKKNENILKIVDTCLRYDAESRFSCVEELIEAIQIARTSGKEKGAVKPRPDRSSRAPNRGAEMLPEVVSEATDEHISEYFSELKRSLAEELAQRYAGLRRGHFEVYGHRDRIITSLCRLLGSAKPGDKYRTMTLPDYWTDTNLGSLGRFLTMNKHMARRGVKIERLFLVSQDFHSLPEDEQVVLEAQLESLLDLERQDAEQAKNLRLKVLRVSEDRIADYERNGELVAYLESHEEQVTNVRKTRARSGSNDLARTICLNFFSTARETWSNGRVIVRRTIKKARYWNPTLVKRTNQFHDSRKRFDKYLETAELLSDFVRQGQPAPPAEIKLNELIGARTRSDAS